MEFSWQNGRQLGGMGLSDETSVSYQYNPDGIRIGKTVNDMETSYFVDASGTMQAMKQGDEELVFMYDATGRREGFIWYHEDQKQGTYYYLYNMQSDVIGMVAEDMNPVVTYEYNAWGKLLSVSGEKKDTVGKLNPFRYRGYVYEEESGLYYVSSRYYDPEVGRFLNADGVISGIGGAIQGYNLFVYCFNNPVNMDDITGHWPSWSQVFTGIAVVAGAVAAVAIVAVTCGGALAVVGGGIVSGSYLTTIATGALIIAGATTTAAVVAAKVESTKYSPSPKPSPRNHNVYIMRDKTTKKVKYVGRTISPDQRQIQHNRDPRKTNLEPLEVKFFGLTKNEARIMEQVLISTYTLDSLANCRREIAVGNVKGFIGEMNNIISIFDGMLEDEILNLMGR